MLYLLVALDGIFPPVPSESGVITMATLAAAGGHLQLVVILLVAAAGAFTGDQIAYSLGRRVNPRTLPLLRSARGVRTVDWAEATLTRRGPAVILAARFLPVARVAVNLTAGAVGYPRTGFTALTAISALTWSAWIKPTTLGDNNIIFSRREDNRSLSIGLANGAPYVEVNGQRSAAGTPIALNAWRLRRTGR
jgi:membrane protein DedA with SNARE-associated domain